MFGPLAAGAAVRNDDRLSHGRNSCPGIDRQGKGRDK
jgi:hypothetical protein